MRVSTFRGDAALRCAAYGRRAADAKPAPTEQTPPSDDDSSGVVNEPAAPVAAESSVVRPPDPETKPRTVWKHPKRSPAPDPLFFGGFGCQHASMVHLAFGDGSVKRLSTSMDQQVLPQLSNRADGKLLSAIDR